MTFFECSQPWRTPSTLGNIKIAALVSATGFCGAILWIAYGLWERLTGDFLSLQFAFGCAFGVSVCISVSMIAGAIAGRLYLNYSQDLHRKISMTSQGFRYQGNIWPWDRVRSIDATLIPQLNIARLRVRTKRGWCVGAMSLAVEIPLIEAELVIGKLRSYLEKSGYHLIWRELGSGKK